jgi:hypothetical protein
MNLSTVQAMDSVIAAEKSRQIAFETKERAVLVTDALEKMETRMSKLVSSLEGGSATASKSN